MLLLASVLIVGAWVLWTPRRTISCGLLAVLAVSMWAAWFALFPFTEIPPLQAAHWLNSKRPLLLAHRGSRCLGPENVLQTLRLALQQGADVLEMDVQLTSDGVLIVAHDDTLLRTAGDARAVASLSWDELSAVNVGFLFTSDENATRPFESVPVFAPRFADVLAAFPYVNMNIEIKPDSEKAAAAVAAALRAEPDPELRFVVVSRHCRTLRAFRRLAPSIPTSACEGEAVWLAVLTSLRVYAWHAMFFSPPPAHVFQLPMATGPLVLASEAVVAQVHATGQRVHYWVVNELEDIREVFRYADGVITDRIDLAAAELRRNASWEAEIGSRAHAWGDAIALHVPKIQPREIHSCTTFMCKFLRLIL